MSGKGGPLRKIGPYAWSCMLSMFFTARCMSSVRPSVCPSDCDVGGSGPHSLEILETKELKPKPIDKLENPTNGLLIREGRGG